MIDSYSIDTESASRCVTEDFFQDKLALDQGLFTNNGGSRS